LEWCGSRNLSFAISASLQGHKVGRGRLKGFSPSTTIQQFPREAPTSLGQSKIRWPGSRRQSSIWGAWRQSNPLPKWTCHGIRNTGGKLGRTIPAYSRRTAIGHAHLFHWSSQLLASALLGNQRQTRINCVGLDRGFGSSALHTDTATVTAALGCSSNPFVRTWKAASFWIGANHSAG